MAKAAIVFAHWLVAWALCGATMMVGRAAASIETALVIHAVLAPIFFFAVSTVYFRKFHYTAALQTAAIFTLLTIAADALLVAPVFEKSYAMFKSFIGTWLVFGLIFAATYAAGILSKPPKPAGSDLS